MKKEKQTTCNDSYKENISRNKSDFKNYWELLQHGHECSSVAGHKQIERANL